MEKFVNRILFASLQKSLEEKYISVILGPRQIGKTTLTEKLIKASFPKNEAQKVLRLNFDDPQLRVQLSKNPNYLLQLIEATFGQTLENISDRKFLFLDEAQKSPEIFDILKIIFDTYPEKIKIFLTGSSSINLLKNSSETLAGRVRFYRLFPLTWREIIFSEKNISTEKTLLGVICQKNFSKDLFLDIQKELFSEKDSAIRLFDRYLLSGGLPEIFLMSKAENRSEALANYTATYLERDIQMLPQIKNKLAFIQALGVFLLRDTQIFNQLAFSQEIGIERPTLKNYLNILEETFLLKKMLPFVKKTKQSAKNPKLYFFDHGLVNFAKKIFSLDLLQISEAYGLTFENLIANNLFAHFSNDPEAPEINFWRDYNDHEIDLVISNHTQIIPLEITVSKKITNRKINNFKAFYAAFPEADNGFLVWTGDFSEISIGSKKIFTIPHWMWW